MIFVTRIPSQGDGRYRQLAGAVVRYLRVVLRGSRVFEKGQEIAIERAAAGPGVVVWMLEQG